MRFAFFIHRLTIITFLLPVRGALKCERKLADPKVDPGIFEEDLMSTWFPIVYLYGPGMSPNSLSLCLSLLTHMMAFYLIVFRSFMELIHLGCHFPGSLLLQETSPKT